MGLLLSLALERLQRLSRELNAKPRNLPLLKERIERTKIACLSWLPNSKERSRPTNSRSKKLRDCCSQSCQVPKGSARTRRNRGACKACYGLVNGNLSLLDPIWPPTSLELKNNQLQNLQISI